MDFRQLRYFVEIAEAGSFSKAAETLRIAQPSLSQHVRSLEEELGVELLERHARGVTPTDLGLVLCEHARSILRELSRTRELMRSAAESPVGQISLGLPTSACRGLAVPLIEAVADRYPGIAIHLVEAMTGSLDEWIEAGRLDVALLYDHRAFENISATEVMIEDIMLIAPATSPLRRERAVRFSEIHRLPIALPSRPHVIRSVIEQNAARCGIKPNVEIDCDSLQGLIQLVRNGYMTLLPAFAFAEEIARGELFALPLVDPTPSWRLSIVLSKRTRSQRAAKAVAQLMHEVIRGMVTSGVWRAQLKSIEDVVALPPPALAPMLEHAALS